MENPKPINFMTSQEVRGLGWQAEARDGDGHLISTQAGLGDIGDFVRENVELGCTVTVWPTNPKKQN